MTKRRRALAIDDLPPRYQEQARRQIEHQRRPAPKPLPKHAFTWEAYVEKCRAVLVANKPVRKFKVFIPTIVLGTINDVIRGSRKENIHLQNRSKREARAAIVTVDPSQWRRIITPCHLAIYQCGKARRVDAPNLFEKAVIDCLTVRSEGVGILDDDSRQYIYFAGRGYATTEKRDGIIIELTTGSEP
jgi:hypothetical protein